MEAKKASHRQVLRRLQDRIFDLIFTVRWKGWGQSPFDSAPFGKLRATRPTRPDPMIGSRLRPAVTLTEVDRRTQRRSGFRNQRQSESEIEKVVYEAHR